MVACLYTELGTQADCVFFLLECSTPFPENQRCLAPGNSVQRKTTYVLQSVCASLPYPMPLKSLDGCVLVARAWGNRERILHFGEFQIFLRRDSSMKRFQI